MDMQQDKSTNMQQSKPTDMTLHISADMKRSKTYGHNTATIYVHNSTVTNITIHRRETKPIYGHYITQIYNLEREKL